uniref:Uncharacterized protein n=1 Tax=Eptatretus burgeri TaxID=7764 RepID=A0A8C4Q384_EPTBU
MSERLPQSAGTVHQLRVLFDAVLAGNGRVSDGDDNDEHVASLLCPREQQTYTRDPGTSYSPKETESQDVQLLRLTIMYRLAGVLCLGNTPRVSPEGKKHQTYTLTLLHTLVHQNELFVHLDAMLDSPSVLLSYHAARCASAVTSSLLYWDPLEYGWLRSCLHRLCENVSVARLLPGIRATADLVRALGHSSPSLPHTVVWQSCLETQKFAVTRLLNDNASSFDCRPCSWLLRIFGDQDDDLVEALLAAIQLWQLGVTRSIRTSFPSLRGGSCRGWNPCCHFFSLLQHVAFDPSVLLDFLLSTETRFLEYLVRFLKFLQNRESASRHWAAGHYERQRTVRRKVSGSSGGLPPQQISTTRLVEYDSSSGVSGEEENSSQVSCSQSGFDRRACRRVVRCKSGIEDVKKEEDGCNVKRAREENIDTEEGKQEKEGCVMESKRLNDHKVELHHQMKLEKNKVVTRLHQRTLPRRRCSFTRRPWRSKAGWIHRKNDRRGISALSRGKHKPGRFRIQGRASNRAMCRSASRWWLVRQCLLDLAGRITRLQAANLFPYQPGPLLNLLEAACRRQRS